MCMLWCLHFSAAMALDPAIHSFRVKLSGDVTVRSRAADLPHSQFGMSTERVCPSLCQLRLLP